MQLLLTKNFPLIKRYTFNVNNSTLNNVICCLNCINICNRIWNFFSSISRVDAEFIQKFISWWIVYMKANLFTIIILKYNFDVQSCFTQLQFIYYVTHYTFDCLLFFINYHRITAFKTKLPFFPLSLSNCCISLFYNGNFETGTFYLLKCLCQNVLPTRQPGCCLMYPLWYIYFSDKIHLIQ